MFQKIVTVYIMLQAAAFSSGKPTDPFLRATMHPDCQKNYCFHQSDDYPQTLIDQLIEKENLIETVDDFKDRDGDIVNNVCKTITPFQPIYEIIDHNDTVRYVVQTSDNAKRGFRQKLRMEECVNPGPVTQSNRNITINTELIDLDLPQLSYYEFSCLQTYMDYSFLVISLDGQKIEAAKAKGGIPVCCKCIVKEKDIW